MNLDPCITGKVCFIETGIHIPAQHTVGVRGVCLAEKWRRGRHSNNVPSTVNTRTHDKRVVGSNRKCVWGEAIRSDWLCFLCGGGGVVGVSINSAFYVIFIGQIFALKYGGGGNTVLPFRKSLEILHQFTIPSVETDRAYFYCLFN